MDTWHGEAGEGAAFWDEVERLLRDMGGTADALALIPNTQRHWVAAEDHARERMEAALALRADLLKRREAEGDDASSSSGSTAAGSTPFVLGPAHGAPTIAFSSVAAEDTASAERAAGAATPGASDGPRSLAASSEDSGSVVPTPTSGTASSPALLPSLASEESVSLASSLEDGAEVDLACARRIERDVPRSFAALAMEGMSTPPPPLPPAAHDSLRRVLLALSVAVPEVGYCQGQNLLAAALLAAVPEHCAFAVARTLLRQCDLAWLYQPHSPALAHLTTTLEEAAASQCPRLCARLAAAGLPLLAVAVDWFASVFVGGLAWPAPLAVVDLLLHIPGGAALVLTRMALAALAAAEGAVLAGADSDDTVGDIKRAVRRLQPAVVVARALALALPAGTAQQLLSMPARWRVAHTVLEVEGHALGAEGVVYYRVAGRCCGHRVRAALRFSELRRTHALLLHSGSAALPPFPPRTLWRRSDTQFVEARAALLNSYLQQLCAAIVAKGDMHAAALLLHKLRGWQARQEAR